MPGGRSITSRLEMRECLFSRPFICPFLFCMLSSVRALYIFFAIFSTLIDFDIVSEDPAERPTLTLTSYVVSVIGDGKSLKVAKCAFFRS